MKKNINNIPLLSNDSKTGEKMQEEKFLKTGQVAKLLNVPKRTLQDWASKGILIPAKTLKNDYHNYNLYTERQIKDFCKSAQNLLAKFQKCAKSPSIKNKSAQNLKNSVQIIKQSAQNLLSENSSNINKYNLSYPTVNYSAKTKVSNRLFRPTKDQIQVDKLHGLKTTPYKKDLYVYSLSRLMNLTKLFMTLLFHYMLPVTLYSLLTPFAKSWLITLKHVLPIRNGSTSLSVC